MTVCQHANNQQLDILYLSFKLWKVSHLLVYLKIWKMLWCYTELIIDPVNITAFYLFIKETFTLQTSYANGTTNLQMIVRHGIYITDIT